jgi:hypothetical protein
LILLAFETAAQAHSPIISADELVRRTAMHEVTATAAGGHYQYRFEEYTANGSETRNVLESRS